MSPLPANATKHLNYISHPLPRDPSINLHLKQVSSTNVSSSGSAGGATGTTGTTLWLGAQVMACYLRETLVIPPTTSITISHVEADLIQERHEACRGRPRILELGSGVGYLALFLASRGYSVTATDIEPVLSTVLQVNIENGLRVLAENDLSSPTGQIETMNLDWEEVSTSSSISWPHHPEGEQPTFSQIITTDTLYHPSLIQPLFRTLRHLSISQKTIPPILIALENRDPNMIGDALRQAKEMGFEFRRVSAGRIGKCVEKSGWGWEGADWEGIEILRGKWRG